MRWRKLGLVFGADGSLPWAQSHAMAPTPIQLARDRLRIYITCLDANGVGRPSFVEVDASDPTRVVRAERTPVLEVGVRGAFDDNGVLATCVLEAPGGKLFMYYVGFERCTKIRYRLLTGLAISDDHGLTFSRHSHVPVLERSEDELYFRGGPFVRYEDERFRMWYVAGSSWTDVEGKELPVYEMKYTESNDGVTWPARGQTCLALTSEDEHGFGRPYVVRLQRGYELHYSIRKRFHAAYRLGYATSLDGLSWAREDSELGLDVSPTGWDSEAIMYSAVTNIGGKTYLFYNGNDFGRDGFGVAVLEKS